MRMQIPTLQFRILLVLKWFCKFFFFMGCSIPQCLINSMALSQSGYVEPCRLQFIKW